MTTRRRGSWLIKSYARSGQDCNIIDVWDWNKENGNWKFAIPSSLLPWLKINNITRWRHEKRLCIMRRAQDEYDILTVGTNFLTINNSVVSLQALQDFWCLISNNIWHVQRSNMTNLPCRCEREMLKALQKQGPTEVLNSVKFNYLQEVAWIPPQASSGNRQMQSLR